MEHSVSGSVHEAVERKGEVQPVVGRERYNTGVYFQMPLHYPRYTKADYETMPEWKLDCVLAEYGLPIRGNLEQKRRFAMGAFLWTPY